AFYPTKRAERRELRALHRDLVVATRIRIRERFEELGLWHEAKMLALGPIRQLRSGDALYRTTYWEWAGAMRRLSPPRERRGGTRPPAQPGGLFLSARFVPGFSARG